MKSTKKPPEKFKGQNGCKVKMQGLKTPFFIWQYKRIDRDNYYQDKFVQSQFGTAARRLIIP